MSPLSDEDKKKIGGSDAAAIIGISKHKAPIDVWRRIVEGHEQEDTKPMRRGRLMEPVIREMVREDYSLTLLGPRKIHDPNREHLRASLDDVANFSDHEEPVEFKSVSSRARDDWNDGVPQEYLCQVQYYLDFHKGPRARLYALIGVDDLRPYVIEADPNLQGMLIEAVNKFYKDHILTRKPPAPDGSNGYREYVLKEYPRATTGKAIVATKDADIWAERFYLAKGAMQKAEDVMEQSRRELELVLQDNKVLQGNGYKVVWNNTQRDSISWKKIAEELGASKELIEKHTSIVPTRQFRFYKERVK